MNTTKGDLQRARIFEVDEKGEKKKSGGVVVECMFNPFEYTVSKSNSYSEKAKNKGDTPQMTFSKAGPQTLKLSLIFDTYEDGEDVSKMTNKLWKLMETKAGKGKKKDKEPPPEVAFSWGVFHFVAVITNMTQKFTMFTKDGTPVRAKVDVTFTQHKDRDDYRNQKQNPTSGDGPFEERRQIIAGDRLEAIAAEVYRDATKWRLIAERNNIHDPLALRPGQYLIIPEI